MRSSKMLVFLILAALVLPGVSILSSGSDTPPEGTPTRGLKGYKETLNISLPKPIFYGTDDPHYTADVEQNTWEDIAFVIMIQSSDQVTRVENQGSGTETAQCADIYQAAFVPLDGKTVRTGTQQRIMVEDFTATWCTYCTGVIGAMNRLDLDASMFPNKYIGIEWHSGGGTYGQGVPYDKALERRSFYSIAGGIPRYITDGMDPYVGGSSSANSSAIDDRIRSSIQSRTSVAPISIEAHAGHTASQAWVEFTFIVESDTFNNPNVDAHVVLAQDAYPRRHGTNPEARLGWIAQDLHSQKVLQKEAPLVQLEENLMADDIDRKGHVEGEFEIQWKAQDKEDGSLLKVDLHYAQGRGEWMPIALNIPNSGSYKWDTFDPRVPDGEEYKIMIAVTDSDDMTGRSVLSFDFEINNPDEPALTVSYPSVKDVVMTGTGEVRWKAWDDEDDPLDLLIDLKLSDDLGSTYETLAEGLDNTGSYSFDTKAYEDGEEYMIEVSVADPLGLTNVSTTSAFTIFNNDPPSVSFVPLSGGSTVSGTFEFAWEAVDEEDGTEEMTYDLSIMYIDDGVWVKLASSQANRGAFEIDTLELEYGDGDYRLRIIVRDSLGEYSEEALIDFEVYNPDLPVILNTQAPRSPLTGTVQFYYTLSDPDNGETPFLSPSFYISGDGAEWDLLSGNVANTGTFELDTLDLDDGTYLLKIRVNDPVMTEQYSEFIFPEFEVNNPDAPTLTIVGYPMPGSNNTGDISLSWDGDDLDGDVLRYYIYYSEASLTNWIPLNEAQGITASSFIWNTSGMDSGDYMLKIVARDGSKADLEVEALVNSFHIYVPSEDTGKPGGDDKKVGSSGSGDDGALLILVVVGLGIILILVALGSVILVLKRKQAPPPQQFVMPPGYKLPPQGVLPNQLPPQMPPQLPPQQAAPSPQQMYIPPPSGPQN
ncbi:MAG: hypothetical protein ACMUHM_08940 [Thermoplasmatota archaeon]